MILGQRRTTIFVVVMFIGTLIPLIQVPNTDGYLINLTSLKDHSPIYINGDSQFTSGNGVAGGNGTKEYPYIIENWSIDATTEDGIEIRNTNSHFIIRNCYIYNGTNNSNDKNGIALRNLKNGSVLNNELEINYYGIYLFTINNCSIYDNSIFNNTIGLWLIRTNNSIIYNNEIYNNSRAGMIVLESDNIIYNNTVYNNSNEGIYISTVAGNILFNNTIFNNTYNFGAYGYNVIYTNNTVNNKPIYYWIKESNKTIPGDAGYVGLIECNNITVTNLTINNNYAGISLISSFNCTVKNNKIINNKIGIEIRGENNTIINNTGYLNDFAGINLFQSNNNSIIKNNFYSNVDGIKIYQSKNIIVANNNCSNNSVNGIHLLNLNLGKIFNNSINLNKKNGIDLNISNNNLIYNNNMNINNNGLSLYDSKKNNIYKNLFISNIMFGIFLKYSEDNKFFDNFFNNTLNFKNYLSKNNIWNISKTIGKNIIDGPYLGGNYWSNYTGIDKNGDGLGDTDIPFSPGDYLPLCTPNDLVKPIIIGKTSGSPITDSIFTISANVTDNIHVNGTYVEYWFDQEKPDNISLNRISGNNQSGEYSINILVPIYAQMLKYFISAVDSFNNWDSINLKVINIVDNKKPEFIQDLSDFVAYTNETFNFSLKVKDNIEPISAAVEYYYGSSGQHKFLTLIKDENYFNGSIQIPNAFEKLNYRFLFNDSNPSNSNSTLYKQIDVLDKEKPSIIAGTGNILSTTGETFVLSVITVDNIEIDYVKILYTNSTTWTEKIINSVINKNYSASSDYLSIDTSNDISDWRYYFYIEDSSGNNITHGSATNPFVITIIDNDKPNANAGKDITTTLNDGSVEVTFDSSKSMDNIGIKYYRWSFIYQWIPKMLFGKKIKYIFESSGSYKVTLNVSDAAGNWDTDEILVTVNPGILKDLKVKLISPQDGDIVIGSDVELQWETNYSNAKNVTYDYYFGLTPNVEKVIANMSSTTVYISDLDEKLTYYWRVQPWLNNQPGIISPIWKFTVEFVKTPFFQLNITADKSELSIQQGDTTSIKLTITNLGDLTDYVRILIDHKDFPGSLAINKDQLIIDPQESIETKISIDTGFSTSLGSYEIILKAISETAKEEGQDVSDSITISIDVHENHKHDKDHDGLHDDWEFKYFGDISIYGADDDPDLDGKTNLQEYNEGTDPTLSDIEPDHDIDNDNLLDSWEIEYFGDISLYTSLDDPDNDGITNIQEFENVTDPTESDLIKKDKKSNPSSDNNLLIIIASVIVILIIVLALSLMISLNKKEKRENIEPKIQAVIETEKLVQQPLIQQPQQIIKPHQPEDRSCSTCGLSLKYYSQNNKYYCNFCKKYD